MTDLYNPDDAAHRAVKLGIEVFEPRRADV